MTGLQVVNLEWVRIPGGRFIKGLSIDTMEKFSMGWIKGIHTPEVIELPTFYISRYPITCGQFAEFTARGAPPHRKHIYDRLHDYHNNPLLVNHPVYVKLQAAEEFCEWINARLPTTLEWEKAARGTDGRLFPWGNEWDADRGNFGRRGRRGAVEGAMTSPVNAYPEGVSPYGVWDLMGNAYEWTSTAFDEESYIIRGSDTKAPDRPGYHLVVHMGWGGRGHLEGPAAVTFRPALDEVQFANWKGFPP